MPSKVKQWYRINRKRKAEQHVLTMTEVRDQIYKRRTKVLRSR